jgi:hypothetical protein
MEESFYKHLFSTPAIKFTRRMHVCSRYPRTTSQWKLSSRLAASLLKWLWKNKSAEDLQILLYRVDCQMGENGARGIHKLIANIKKVYKFIFLESISSNSNFPCFIAKSRFFFYLFCGNNIVYLQF